MNYPCTKCSLCCYRAKEAEGNMIRVAKALGADPGPFLFPYQTDSKTGKCSQLTEEGLCGVYETRPLLCNIDRMAAWLNIDLETFYKMNAEVCNHLIEKAGLDTKFKVKI